jgi:hypothetical protein
LSDKEIRLFASEKGETRKEYTFFHIGKKSKEVSTSE